MRTQLCWRLVDRLPTSWYIFTCIQDVIHCRSDENKFTYQPLHHTNSAGDRGLLAHINYFPPVMANGATVSIGLDSSLHPPPVKKRKQWECREIWTFLFQSYHTVMYYNFSLRVRVEWLRYAVNGACVREVENDFYTAICFHNYSDFFRFMYTSVVAIAIHGYFSAMRTVLIYTYMFLSIHVDGIVSIIRSHKMFICI